MSLTVENNILWNLHDSGIYTVICADLRAEERGLNSGRFAAFSPHPLEYAVKITWDRRIFTEAIDWIEDFEVGAWSFRQDDHGAWFSFDDYVTAVQFKLTHVN